uniref:GPN-loop GTPase n=1 Tax=Dermatophagoides pteronyssinus TaxID=6956 RepID=A0A6P6Y7D3_DERPT|nr:GPN-loop GTPase 3-like [Dermatophagoides pteronyssinus]
MIFAVMVIGPAGCGKTTFCSNMRDYYSDAKRRVCLVNLDCAADASELKYDYDIRTEVTTRDIMKICNLGPNEALLRAFEYLRDETHWVEEVFEASICDGEIVLLDCPGQIELYMNSSAFQDVVKSLQNWDYRLVTVYTMDASFALDANKLVSGTLCALTAMLNLATANVTMITKVDLLDAAQREALQRVIEEQNYDTLQTRADAANERNLALLRELNALLDDWSYVTFLCMDINDDRSLIALKVLRAATLT